jgi:vitamin B12 transporter
MFRLLSFLIFSTLTPAHAEETQRIVVTANRLETPEDAVASSVSVITGFEIEKKQTSTVADALREVPGLSVVNQGGLGRTTFAFIRGTNPGQLLVLLDGVRMNDPLNGGTGFNFGTLSTDGVERIEVVRGAQSVMYGSDAIGGVINIITKKGRGPLKGNASLEYGSYNSWNGNAGISGSQEKTHYALSAGYQTRDGFSVADETLGNTEKDGSRLLTLSGKGGTEISPGLSAEVLARFSDSQFSLDQGGGAPTANSGDDPNFTSTDQQFYSLVQLRYSKSAYTETLFGLSWMSNQRTDDDSADVYRTSFLQDSFKSSRLKAQLQNNLFLDDENTVTLGLEGYREGGSITSNSNSGNGDMGFRTVDVGSLFIEEQLTQKKLFGSLGLRLDGHSRFGSHLTYRLAPGYRLESTGTTVKASVGSGFRAPDSYQLFSPLYGETGLRPETTVGMDFGAEQKVIPGVWVLSATFFYNVQKDLIEFNSGTNRFANVAKSSASGLELTSKNLFSGGWTWNTSYTYTFAKDDTTGFQLKRRPKHQVSTAVEYRPSDYLQTSLQLLYVGERADTDAVSFSRKEMPPHYVVRLAGDYEFQKSWRVFARVENVLDRVYEEADGYGTSRRAFYVGLKKEI